MTADQVGVIVLAAGVVLGTWRGARTLDRTPPPLGAPTLDELGPGFSLIPRPPYDWRNDPDLA